MVSTKKIIIIIAALIFISAVWYGLYEYNREPEDNAFAKASFSLTTAQFCQDFLTDEKRADSLYIGKTIEVAGVVSAVKVNAYGTITIIFSDSSSGFSILCGVDSLHKAEAEQITVGSFIIVKGECSAFNFDELLGSDIFLNRCAIISNKKN